MLELNYRNSTYKKVMQRIKVILLVIFIFFLGGCNDFLTKDITLGVPGEKSTDDTTTDSPEDDDNDGLSNEVEEEIQTLANSHDSDFDGFSDGLEYVLDSGDPLDPNVSPETFTKATTADTLRDSDGDGDGLGDEFENSNSLDPDNRDTDSDGYDDGLELLSGSNPFEDTNIPTRNSPPNASLKPSTGIAPTDTDGDGISDRIEGATAGDANSADSDGDGFSDGLEFFMGSSIIDNTSVPNFSVPPPPENSTDDEETTETDDTETTE